MSFTREDVAEILELLDQLEATELHLRTGRFALWLRRDGPGGDWVQATSVRAEPHLLDAGPQVAAVPAQGGADGSAGVAAEATAGRPDGPPAHPDGPPAHPAGPPAHPAGPVPPAAAGGTAGRVAVHAPLMGTFYRAPKPGADPFVDVGACVDEHTVVGIVETMKLMTSVYAGARGRVSEICLGNAQPAEQGAVLIWIAPEQPE